MATWLRAYNVFLQREPMRANMLTTGALSGTGDVLAQQAIERKGREHDFARTARQTFYGGVLLAPLVVKWYGWLNRLRFASPRRAVLAKVALDQVVFAPVSSGSFFVAMSLLEGADLAQTRARLATAYLPTLLRGYAVFVPAQLVNFALVPPHLQFAAVGAVRVLWNSYLSLVNVRAGRQVSGGAREIEPLPDALAASRL